MKLHFEIDTLHVFHGDEMIYEMGHIIMMDGVLLKCLLQLRNVFIFCLAGFWSVCASPGTF